MTFVDVMNRVQQLRTQLGLDQPTSATATSGTDFASALGAAQESSGTLATGTSAGGDAVVADARKYLGIKYVYGSNDPSKGLDCSGLVQTVYSDLGVKLPRVAADQARQGTAVPSLAQAKPGDLVAFGSPVDHIGIYIGNNQMIVAPHTGDVVKVEKVYTTPTAIRRILPDTASASASSILPALRPSSLSSGSALGVQYSDLFTSTAQKYGLDPALLAGVAKVESGYNARAVSGAGAEGLMQLMPGTARGLGVDPFNPAQAIDGAARLLKRNLDEFGSLPLALAAYNAGGGAVHRYGGIPPYPETQAYVRNILAMLKDG
jgi:hypothetical protein